MDKEYTSGCVCLGTVEGGGYEVCLEINRRVYSPIGCICTLTTHSGTSLAKVMVDEHKQDDNGGNG